MTALNTLPVLVTEPGIYRARNGCLVLVESLVYPPEYDGRTTAFPVKGSLWAKRGKGKAKPYYKAWHVSGRLQHLKECAHDIVSRGWPCA